MDLTQFAPWTRRRFSLLAGGVAASLLGIGLNGEGEAKRGRRKRKAKKRRNRCLKQGRACTTTSFPGNGGCCAGTRCDCGTAICLVGIPGTCLVVLDED